jgi:hypothetical protein
VVGVVALVVNREEGWESVLGSVVVWKVMKMRLVTKLCGGRERLEKLEKIEFFNDNFIILTL